MIWVLLAGHAAAAALLALRAARGRRAGRTTLAISLVAPGATAAWSIGGLVRGGDTTRTSVDWVDGLGLEFAFVVDPLSTLLVTIVSGIGVAIALYAAGYFTPDAPGLDRFAATMTAFSAAMVGLVLADSVWTLFVFWELTSVTSYLLVGTKHQTPSVRAAARRALMITGAGGLALLGGLVVLVDGAGTTSIRALDPVDGAGAHVAVVLVLVAAATKSAQVPFHVWLPGAMSAPTPVSAYLHSATMVKAGVVVVAVLAPALGAVSSWTPLGIAFGLASMIWGGIGALRQLDAKLVLAWGTVSQLGLMIVLLSAGTGKATFAGLAVLAAHAVFKAALFMIVGEIDVRCGTRRIDRLASLRRTMPLAFAVAFVSGISMAGAGPVLGFAAKEAAVEAALGLDGTTRTVVLVGVVAGSVLTVAYTLRLLLGLFGDHRGGTAPGRTEPVAARAGFRVSAVLAAVSIVGFVLLPTFADVVRDAAVVLDDDAASAVLYRWPGFTTAFNLSVGIVAVGLVVGWAASCVRRDAPAPRGEAFADASIDSVLGASRRVAGRVQHGSLPIYLTTTAFVAAAGAAPFLAAHVDDARAWDHAAQPVLGLLTVAGAVATVFVGSRVGAALGLGAVGFGVAGLFVVKGAPDLALTQLLVETVIVVGFVVGLGHLGREFPRVGVRWRIPRLIVSLAAGAAVTLGLLAAGDDPSGAPPLDAMAARSVSGGGGSNIVNVILTDMRALDTLGEIVVLLVVAVGIAALARAGRESEEVTA